MAKSARGKRVVAALAVVIGLVSCGLQAAFFGSKPAPAAGDGYLSPSALAASPDGKTLYVACQTANQVLVYDLAGAKVAKTVPMPAAPTGLALSKDGTKLFVTCAAPKSFVCVVNTASGKVADTLAAGHTAMSPVLSPDEKTLYICNRFNNEIQVVDLASRKDKARIPVLREPYAAAITPDGATLFVANHLHNGPASADVVAAKVTVIDTATGKVSSQLELPNGSGLLCDVRVSPNGQYAAVSHLLARFHLPTTQLERGWMNTDAVTLIDAKQKKVINTVLVDSVDSGAANPYGLAWSADSKSLYVAHAGTHEVSLIDAVALLDKLSKMPTNIPPGKTVDYTSASRIASDVPNDLSYLVGIRHRVKVNQYGPRAIAVAGGKVYTANYFSDSLSVVDPAAPVLRAATLALGPTKPMSVVRRGEFIFNDASICFQGWQTCASCHSFDARVDGLNWDLLNDGIGNPKNSKTLLLSHKTPPAMSMGVRDTAETAVRAGIRHILFTVQPEDVPTAMDEYLKRLQPIPSPYLVDGKLSKAAERGKKIYNSSKVGCASCHPEGLFTDQKHYDVGTKGQYDRSSEFDTPTLIEVWRTAPYLHDGSAVTIKDVLTTSNKGDKHGKTSHLSPQEIEDLALYILSL